MVQGYVTNRRIISVQNELKKERKRKKDGFSCYVFFFLKKQRCFFNKNIEKGIYVPNKGIRIGKKEMKKERKNKKGKDGRKRKRKVTIK